MNNEHSVLCMDEHFLEKLTEIVWQHLDDSSFCVEDLARIIGLSRSQLYRKISTLTGLSVSQFIREKRLTHAFLLLKKNAGTVSEIAYQTGFSSPNYFNRCFKEKFQISPGQVKREKKNYKAVSFI